MKQGCVDGILYIHIVAVVTAVLEAVCTQNSLRLKLFVRGLFNDCSLSHYAV
jgi:hypothetical protein